MKHNLLKSVILSVILLLGANSVWGYNEYNKQYLYFDGSEFTSFYSDNCTPYISPKWDYNCSDGNSNGGDKQMTSITSNKYYYLDLSESSSSYKSFRGFYIGRSASFYNGKGMGVVHESTSNCIKATGWGTYQWTNFAPPMKSVTISNNGSTVYGGDGTSNNPYQIKKGATISVQASATSSVPNDPQTKYYKFYKKENSGARSAIGNESTTTTSSFTASNTAGTKYEVDVEARNEYYGTYGEEATSSTLYFITIEPIYAILGSFNSWNHSAATWDLSDQGSDNWKATFHLEQGNHTFKVVHNSSYYGKNSTTITRSSATASSLSTSGDNINLTADYAGNYTFTFNSSTKNLTVTYPTIYKVTYSQTPAAAADAPTTNPSVTSGNSVVAGTSVTFTAKTAKTGYTWKGWYGNDAGSGTALSANQAYTTSITANTTIYAVYTANTYTVAFNANGGTGTMSNQNFTYGTTQNLTTNAFTRTGYSFAGWNTKADGTGTSYTDKQSVNNLTSTNGETVTLYAKWTPITYTVKFNGNGSTSGSMSNQSFTYDEAAKALTTNAFKKTGYTFAGWNTATDGSGTNYADGARVQNLTTTNNATINLYAKWTANTYAVTLNPQSGTGGTTSVTATYGSAMPAITKPTRTGYTFNGYYDATSGGTQYYKADGSSARTWNKTAATTLYAQWTANQYTITYKDQNNADFSGSHASGYPTKHTYGTATTLKDATKTGYTFGGWHTDQACTNKVTSLGATTYTDNITLYAKWTINQYTLDFGASEGGSVVATVKGEAITSPATLEHGTSVTLTATPTTGNVFVQWVNENGTTVSTDNPYTFNLTANKTVKAEFAPPTTVYLKPLDFWPSDNARFAIYIWEGDRNKWVEMESVDCEKQYYSANIPSGYTNFKYVRLNPTGKGDASKNDGLHWDYKWNETGDLTVQKDLLYITPRIYIKPNANWKQADARFAAYFYEDGKEAQWMSMYKDGDYYYCNVVNGYSKVIFCRMNPATETNEFANCWNKSADQTIAGNCFTINANEWGCNGNGEGNDGKGAAGKWSEYHTTFTTPTYDVTIKPTIHGTYSVVCNGRAYPVTYKEDIVIPDVPMGTILTIQDVKPNKETEYTSDIIYKESANATYQKLKGNQITVCGNTTIDENFVTKNTHVVYLRIPNGLAWGTGNYQNLSVYNKLTESYTPTAMTAAAGNYESGYTYYTYTIPAGTHTIRFEYINGNTKYQTHDFPHVMPLGSLNCYTIHSKEGESTVFNSYWSELLSNGDYRLLYVEQTVEKDANNKTIINRRKAHPSDIIPASIISAGDSKVVSLHIFKDRTYTDAVKKYDGGTPTYYESNNNPEVILQQYNSSTNTWENKERHMVFGPLKTLPGMAMAPGRRNAAADAELVYDDGIEIIKSDDHSVHPGSGVWNFTVKQLEGNKATIDLTNVTRYTGEYYIRTDVANGGWFNYNPTNHMTRSDEAKANSNFSHYYCKWVGEAGINVKFTVANDYGYAISDTLEADRTDLWGVALANKMVGDDQKLPEKANVRFAWNEYSNFIHRAYIAGSANVSDRFLVLEGDENIFDENGSQLNVSGLDANQQIFRDNSNWIYYADVQMKPMAPVKVTAKYNGKIQYFIGKQNETVTLLQGSGSEKYLIRMLYDFKTNQLISAYVPGTNPNDVHAISTNLMIIRQNNENATQLMFSNETPSDMINIPTDRRAYGVIEFTKERLIDDKSLNAYARSLYWISFPFNVDVSKAICFGEYGKHWIIQEYNGARRAAEGMWLDSETFWDYKWDQNITLEAGKGYVLALDVDQIASDGLFSLAGNRPIGIYFPSTEYISTAITEQTQVSTTVPAHECTINRATPKGDRRIADSHWNVIGVPSYVNAKGDYQLADIETQPKEVKYYYRWDGDFNAYTAMEKEGTKDFLSTYAYMVQFAGQINWQNIFNVSGAPQALAARQSTDAEKEHRLRLELHQNSNKADHTFVRLQDEDGVTNRFDFNHDLCKVINAGANIYSIITAEESPVEVAANVMPIAETIIPLGVKITAAGEYTFAMPEGTDGIVVELIDYENNTRTNMLLDNYTVNLGKGTFDNRFALHVQPSKVTTSVEDINTNSNGVKKYLIDGILYMQKDGVLYDAQGKLVR